jgi:hypothetical protein
VPPLFFFSFSRIFRLATWPCISALSSFSLFLAALSSSWMSLTWIVTSLCA